MRDDNHAQQPWQWPEATWRTVVKRVRAGRSLRPASWPAARCAVALSFDSDRETNELREGGKAVSRLSWGQFGSRVGRSRIWILEEIVRHARANGVWFATHADIAAYVARGDRQTV